MITYYLMVLFLLYSNIIFAENHWESSNNKNRKNRNPEAGRYTRNIKDFEIVVPQKVNEDSSFLSYFLPHFYDKTHNPRATENDNHVNKRHDDDYKVHYKIRIGGKYHHLELVPNWDLISPNLILERRGDFNNSKKAKARIRRISDDHRCYYNGVVKGHHASNVAISLCSGMAGYIKTNDDSFFIEPLKDEEPLNGGEHMHIVYKRELDLENTQAGFCGTSDKWEVAWQERLIREAMKHNRNGTRKRSTSRNNFIETLIVADKKFLDYHSGQNIENYILTIMNMVSGYFHDASVGNQIDVIIVRIIYLEKEMEEMDLAISPDSSETLASFCKWQVGITPKINHPNHHDIAVLLTRHDLCSSNDGDPNCGLLGLAYVATICEPDKSCCINEDNGLLLGITVTHEMGHVMGCSHDSPESSGCTPETLDKGFYHVMSPIVYMSTAMWSKCSQKFISDILDFSLGECLANIPEDQIYDGLDDMPPGGMYDADFQCSMLHGPNTDACIIDQEKYCETLYCKLDGENCYTFRQPPADGTSCGSKKWCYKKKCVRMGSRPDAVNGGWGAWSPEGECSRTCGGGVAVSERQCDNPKPNHKGRYCLGPKKRYSICKTNKCPLNGPSFREFQCAEKDTTEYSGKHHSWKPYFTPGGNPCELVCLNEENTYRTLEPRAKDGTPCKLGTRNMCISGNCRKVGCDWGLETDAIEDVCGVCGGNGMHCEMVEEIFTQQKGKGYVEITVIPAHSTNIFIEELAETENTIAISAENRKVFFINGNYQEERDGEFKFGSGTIGAYSHPEPQKEELFIHGPTQDDLVLYAVFYGDKNPGVKYRYYAPVGSTGRIPNYHWEFVHWEPCSVRCGGGIRISVPTCIEEEAGEVSASLCKTFPKPEKKVEECNSVPCQTRWKAGIWQDCSGCRGVPGFQQREVQCALDTGNNEEEEIVEDKECRRPKPHEKKECTTDAPCQTRLKKSSKHIFEGVIVKDPIPKDSIQLVRVPIIPGSQDKLTHLSDEAYEKLGDQIPLSLDEKKAQILHGDDRVKEEKRPRGEIKQCSGPC